MEICYNLHNEFSVQLQKQAGTISLSRKSDYCVLGGKKVIYVYNLANLQQMGSAAHIPHKTCNYKKSPYDISCTVWNQFSESRVASAVNSQCILWDFQCTSPVQSSFDAHSRAISDLKWSNFNMDCFATGSADNNVKLWDTRVLKKPSCALFLNSVRISLAVSRIEWNRFDQFLLASSQEGTVSIWDLRRETEPLFHTSGAHMSKITDIDWSHQNANEFITSAGDTMIKFWNISDNSMKCKYTMKTPVRITSSSYHPSGSTVIGFSPSNNSLRVWDSTKLELSPLVLKCGADTISSIDWRRDTKQLIALKTDQSIVSWDIPTKLGNDHFHSDYINTITKKYERVNEEFDSLERENIDGIEKKLNIEEHKFSFKISYKKLWITYSGSCPTGYPYKNRPYFEVMPGQTDDKTNQQSTMIKQILDQESQACFDENKCCLHSCSLRVLKELERLWESEPGLNQESPQVPDSIKDDTANITQTPNNNIPHPTITVNASIPIKPHINHTTDSLVDVIKYSPTNGAKRGAPRPLPTGRNNANNTNSNNNNNNISATPSPPKPNSTHALSNHAHSPSPPKAHTSQHNILPNNTTTNTTVNNTNNNNAHNQTTLAPNSGVPKRSYTDSYLVGPKGRAISDTKSPDSYDEWQNKMNKPLEFESPVEQESPLDELNVKKVDTNKSNSKTNSGNTPTNNSVKSNNSLENQSLSPNFLNNEQQKPNVYTSKALPIQKKGGFLGKAQESFLNKKKLPGDNINTGTANNNENSNNLVHEPKEKAFTLEVKKEKQGLSPSARELRHSPGRGSAQSLSPNFLAKHPEDDQGQARPTQGEKENIPFPRLCSAVFGSNGFLLKIVNVPKEGLPFTKNKLTLVRNYEDFIDAQFDLQRHIPMDVTSSLFHYYYTLATEKKMRVTHSVFDYELCTHVPVISMIDLTSHSLISKQLAMMYTLSGDVQKICQHNERAALSVNREDLVQVWQLLQVITNPLVHKPYDESENFNQFETPWAEHPFGRKLTHSLIQHYEKLGDVQTLTMIFCALSLPERQIRNRNKEDSSRGEKSNCDWTSKLERMASARAKKEIRNATSLLDSRFTEVYHHHAKVYAEILYRFGLFNQCNEILKMVTVDGEKNESFFQEGSELSAEKIDGLTFGRSSVCSNCQLATTSNSNCNSCKVSLNLICSLCRLSVLGFSFVCTMCGHGGHNHHMRDWFKTKELCPTGCGCRCVTFLKTGVQ